MHVLRSVLAGRCVVCLWGLVVYAILRVCLSWGGENMLRALHQSHCHTRKGVGDIGGGPATPPLTFILLMCFWLPEQVALGTPQGLASRVVVVPPRPASALGQAGLSPTCHSCALPQWIERVVGWLGKVFLQDGPARPASPEAGSTLRRWRCHVQKFFYRVYAGLRIEELFSVIRGWPRCLEQSCPLRPQPGQLWEPRVVSCPYSRWLVCPIECLWSNVGA